MGTMIQRYKLGEADFRGERFAAHPKDLKGNNDLLQLTRPDVIREIHDQYLQAGADIIETNTFGATSIAQEDYGLASVARELNVAGARIARAACDAVATPDRPRFVAGALGPTPRTASISPDVNDPAARNVDFDQLREAYPEQAEGLLEGGCDLFLVETIFDTLNAKAAIFALDELMERSGERLPVIISGTVTDASGRILSGQTVSAFWHSVRHARPLAVGLNCALGAALMRPYIEELAKVAGDTFISCYPNAGLPNPMSETGFDETPEITGRLVEDFATRRLPEHRRRLLRHHAGAHRRDRPAGRAATSRAAGTAALFSVAAGGLSGCRLARSGRVFNAEARRTRRRGNSVFQPQRRRGRRARRGYSCLLLCDLCVLCASAVRRCVRTLARS